LVRRDPHHCGRSACRSARCCLGDAAADAGRHPPADIRRDDPRRAPVLAVFPFAAKLVPTFAQALAPMAAWAMVV
jgi:hypothetical protein